MSKKIYCLLLAFILLLSLSCASASEDISTNDTISAPADEIDDIAYDNSLLSAETDAIQSESNEQNLTLETDIDDYGTVSANVAVDTNTTGQVTFSINDSTKEIFNKTVPIENGSAGFTNYSIKTSGLYTIIAKYTGEFNFTSNTTSKIMMVTRSSPDLEIASKIIDNMGNIQINVTLNKNATGNVTLSFNETEISLPIENGTATLTNYNLEKGNYTLQAYYDGDRDFFKAVSTDTLNVTKNQVKLNIVSEISEFGLLNVSVESCESISGNMAIVIKNQNGSEIYNKENIINNGTIIIENPIEISNETYTITATYPGNDDYYAANATANITSTKKQTNLIINPITVDETGKITINATIDENATGTITLQFNNNRNMTLTIENGTATITDLTLPKANYNITATYNGDKNYYKTTTNNTLNITKDILPLNMTSEITETGALYITIETNNITGNVITVIRDKDGKELYNKENEINNGTVFIENPIVVSNETYTITSTFPGNEDYYVANATANITSTKKQATLKINTINIDETGKITINTTIDENATGTVTFQFNDHKNITLTIENATANITDLTLEKANYNITATYNGDKNYYKTTTNNTLNVTKNQAELNITPEIIETGILYITLSTNNLTGNVAVVIRDKNGSELYNKENEINNGTVMIENPIEVSNETYTITATYPGNEDYYVANTTTNITSTKKQAKLNINPINIDQTGKITINTTIDENATGTITLQFNNNKNVTLTIENGTATITDLTLPKANYNITATYNGDKNYYKTTTNNTLNVTKNCPVLNVEAMTDDYGKSSIIATINENATENITISILNETFIIKEFNKAIENGTVSLNDIILALGNYPITASYDGDDNYFKATAYTALDIAKLIPTLNASTTVNDNIIFVNATITNGTTGNVQYTFYENGTVIKESTVAVDNGSASFDEDYQFPKGNYTITIEYLGDETYFKANTTTVASITKETPVINYTIEIKDTAAVIKINIENATGDVAFIGENINTTLTLENGSAELSGTFNPGNNIVIVKYLGDDNYFSNSENITFHIIEPTTIKAYAVSVVYGETANITVILRSNNTGIKGETIQITLKGKTYTATTNKNGKAIVSVPAILVPNKYTCAVKFAGTDYYKGVSTTVKMTVKKLTASLVAPASTYKVATKTKKYTVTLKHYDGKPLKRATLTLKVNGKTYKATTNSYGKAVFKITNLNKRAKYIAKITYLGTKYYNYLSKKVILTVTK